MMTLSTTFPNWFEPLEPVFGKHLAPLAGPSGLRVLQIGAYTGDASVWLLDNFLTGDDCWLIDVDTWEGSQGEAAHDNLDWGAVHGHYLERMRGRPVMSLKMTSDEYFAKYSPIEFFDMVYVDGDHTRDQVAKDAENAHRAVKPGGLLVFDDYGWKGHERGNNPRDAIDAFMAAHRDEYITVHRRYQVWLRKR